MIERFERGRPGGVGRRDHRRVRRGHRRRGAGGPAQPGAGDFFGRITDGAHADRRWYIGRRHIEDDAHDPVVVDWRAPIAAPFYRATGVDPLGPRPPPPVHDGRRRADRLPRRAARRSRRRRRGDRHPRPGAGRDRRRAHRGDARDRRHDPGRAGRRHPRPARSGARRAGRPRHRQDRGRPAPRRVPAVRAPPPAGRATACSWSARTRSSSTTSPTCCRRSASAACSSARRSTCACRRSRSPASTTTRLRRDKGGPAMLDRARRRQRRITSSVPTEDLRIPIGRARSSSRATRSPAWVDEALARRARR